MSPTSDGYGVPVFRGMSTEPPLLAFSRSDADSNDRREAQEQDRPGPDPDRDTLEHEARDRDPCHHARRHDPVIDEQRPQLVQAAPEQLQDARTGLSWRSRAAAAIESSR